MAGTPNCLEQPGNLNDNGSRTPSWGFADFPTLKPDGTKGYRRVYFPGEHDSTESRDAYHRALAEWDAQNRKTPMSTSPSRRTPGRVAFGRDHQSVIVTEFDNDSTVSVQLHLLDARFGAALRTRELDPKPQWVLARTPDGNTFAALPSSRSVERSNADRPGTMLILDSQTLEMVREIDGIPERQLSLALSPDGTRIATGGKDGTARIFAVQTGKLLASSSDQVMEVLTISFSSDGTRLASAGLDRTVRIWTPRRTSSASHAMRR